MDPTLLAGKRVLLTHANHFMGPALREVFEDHGAEVIADEDPLEDAFAATRVVTAAGPIDVLLAHLAEPAPVTLAHEVTEAEWHRVFGRLVNPLPLLLRAVLPQMLARKSGRILVIGSASALRGMAGKSTYSAARGAQLAYVQSVGVELARHGVQVNAIAQNFVENATYFPPELQATPEFQQRVDREVPLGRLVSAREDAMFCAYLCSDSAGCFVGQVFPVSGGWAVR
ncbi:SDR family oxidoreductase [Ramlibacter aurantiacus]|uniref:SDR family oxidoreductase n=1 Tax=Ramlibacter aurantiacus TaxID=2801330 RepID=UPI001F20AC33|nr:SDR family oxidoreductase [Ramlibacter aurantiacus]